MIYNNIEELGNNILLNNDIFIFNNFEFEVKGGENTNCYFYSSRLSIFKYLKIIDIKKFTENINANFISHGDLTSNNDCPNIGSLKDLTTLLKELYKLELVYTPSEKVT